MQEILEDIAAEEAELEEEKVISMKAIEDLKKGKKKEGKEKEVEKKVKEKEAETDSSSDSDDE